MTGEPTNAPDNWRVGARAVFETALDCIVGMDGEGRVFEWNPAAERTFGYSRMEAIGQLLAQLIIPPALRERHRRGFERYLATGEAMVIEIGRASCRERV